MSTPAEASTAVSDLPAETLQAEFSPSKTPSKKEVLINLLQQPEGATLAEMTAATGWQAHSVRGVISGQLKKQRGLNVQSQKRENGQRAYYLKANA